MQRRRASALACGLALCLGASAWGDPPPQFQNEPVLSGLTLPTSLIFLPDGRLLAAEKTGRIVIADPSSAPATPAVYMTITDIAVDGEHGLIDLALDPDFSTNGYLYAYYSRATTGKFRIGRFLHQGSTASTGSETLIWEDPVPYAGRCCHHGGSIDFGPDGKLYLTTGDEFIAASAQDLSSTQGKVLRMNPDGSVPADNPFVDGPGGNDDHVWAYGLRNAFRCRWDLPTQRFFIGEVGSNEHDIAWEDVNLGVAGANYGWPFCEGFCSNPAYTDPLFSYPHLGQGASLTGGIVYRGGNFPAPYQEVYFYGDYVQGWMRYLTFDAFGAVQGTVEFDNSAGATTDIRQGPDGALYYCDIFTGQVRRYVYGAGGPVARDDHAYVSPAGSQAIDVLANDLGDIDPTTVVEVTPPAAGSISIDPVTGEITYTHDGSPVVEDAFSYMVDDNEGTPSNAAEVTIRVLTGDCTLITGGLALHLEAETGVTVNGGDVLAWADQSGLDNDLVSTSGAPQLVAAAINGLPAIAFDGVADALGRTGLNGLSVGPADRTVFLVARYHGPGWGGFEYGAAALNNAFGLGVSPDGYLAVRAYIAPADFVSTEPGTGAGFLVQSVVVSSGQVSHFRGHDLIDTRVHAFNTVSDRIRLGAGLDDASYVDMDVAAVLVYNRALSAAERRTVQDYLQIKYFVDACANLTPHALDDSAAVAPAGSLDIDVLANDADADGVVDSATVTIVDPPLHAAALVVNPVSGVITYTHDGTATTQDSFTYVVADDDGAASNPATVRIVVRDEDCNTNGIPDVDELSANCAENAAVDCNFDGVFDSCDADCDANGASDICALMTGAASDCAGTGGFVGDYEAGRVLHTAFCAGCHNVGGVGGLGGAPNHRNRSRYEYQRKLSACQQVVGHYGGTNSMTIDDFAHLERYLTDYSAPEEARGGDGVPDRCQGYADCDADGIADLCALAAGMAFDCNTNGVPDHCDLAGGTSSDCDMNGVPDECERVLLREDFAAFFAGADPTGWFDTFPDNSLVHNEALFKTHDLGGGIVFGTVSGQTNIHSHYTADGSAGWGAYDFTGRMLMTSSLSGVGVTFWSDYPNSDAYYRLRRGNFSGGFSFHIDPHGTTITGGDLDSGVNPAPNQWYRFHVQIADTGARTEIRANVWPDGGSEPPGWQIDCHDDGPARRTQGTVGVWAAAGGAKYWDDLEVTHEIPDGACDDGDPCTADDYCSNGVCHGDFMDCDGDGACDALDNCPGIPNPDQANADGDVYGDACDAAFDVDHDGDVDADEIHTAIACLQGPEAGSAPACLGNFDVDGDGDVDLQDFAAGQRAFTGQLTSPCD